MKKIIIIMVASLLMAGSVFGEEICFPKKYKQGMEFKNCNEGDILLMKIKSGYVTWQNTIIADYCDYEQVVKTALAAGWHFTCVLKTTTPRKIKEN